MKKFFSALLWFFVLFLLAHVFQYFFGNTVCSVCQSASNKPLQESFLPADMNSKLADFTLSDMSGNTIFTFPSNFIVNSSDASVAIPDAMQPFKDSILTYLNTHQDQELVISAKYLKSEGKPKGLNRANFLKGILTQVGLNADRILPKAVLSDYNYNQKGQYGDGIAMVFQNIPEEQQSIIEKGIAHKTLYAKFGTQSFQPDATLKAYTYELKHYLIKYPDKNVWVTGHTDNVGKADANFQLGLDRATHVVEYLIEQGVAKEHIKADSKGETEPVATNDTEEGRAKNRRITITIN